MALPAVARGCLPYPFYASRAELAALARALRSSHDYATFACIRVSVCIWTCLHVFARICTYVRVPARICAYLRVFACICAYLRVSARICTYFVRLCAFVLVSARICAYLQESLKIMSKCSKNGPKMTPQIDQNRPQNPPTLGRACQTTYKGEVYLLDFGHNCGVQRGVFD